MASASVRGDMDRAGSAHQLEVLLVEGYGRAYRTAYLIMRNPTDAEEAVQEAFLRVWRFRDSLPAGDGIQPWLYRVLVNTCYSQLRKEVPRRDRSAGDAALGGLVATDISPEAAPTEPQPRVRLGRGRTDRRAPAARSQPAGLGRRAPPPRLRGLRVAPDWR